LSLTTAFLQGLNEGGVGPSNVKIENRSAEGQYNRLTALAADLIDHRANIIVAAYLVAARAAEACDAGGSYHFHNWQRFRCGRSGIEP
jgi:putative ABC transport system substrate-binding protein